ncbi:C-GCAxxG-C-C family (seleno)protein [Chloroflexota bacterium]
MAEIRIIESLEQCFETEEERKAWEAVRYESQEDAIIRRCKRDAYEWQIKYRGCGQTCLNSLMKNLGIGSKENLWAASGFGGGCGGIHLCGNLAAGIMALGIVFGRRSFMEEGGPRTRGRSDYVYVQDLRDELRERFKERWCAETCQAIQTAHFGRFFIPYPDLRKNPRDKALLESGEVYDMLSTYASRICEFTAGLTAEIVLRELKKQKELETLSEKTRDLYFHLLGTE